MQNLIMITQIVQFVFYLDWAKTYVDANLIMITQIVQFVFLLVLNKNPMLT